MRLLLLVVLLFFCSAPVATADGKKNPVSPDNFRVFRGTDVPTSQSMEIKIYLDRPCTNKDVITALMSTYGIPRAFIESRFKESLLFWQGKFFPSCWMNLNGYVRSFDQTGEALTAIPYELFKDETL